MKISKLLRPIATYILAMFCGGVLTIWGLRGLPYGTGPAWGQELLADSGSNPPTLLAQNLVGSRNKFIAKAVKKVGEAVVRIDTERVIARRSDPFVDDPLFDRFFGDEFQPQPRRGEVRRGQGSGFIIDRNGLIFTNAHVVNGASRVTVTLKNGRRFVGEVRGADEVTDLAVVQINPQGTNLPVAQLGNSSGVEVGDWAIAVGNPLGLNNTVTLGIVSTIDRSGAEIGISDKRLDFIQTDAAINPGNSGGPLVNDAGEVIGINTAIRADARGIGFAIPINQAKDVQDILATGGTIPHPFLGVRMITLTPDLAQENNRAANSSFRLPEITGALVMRAIPNAPAARAGIRQGDVIVRVDGRPIANAEQLQDAVQSSSPGQVRQFQIIRNGQNRQIRVQIGQLGRN